MRHLDENIPLLITVQVKMTLVYTQLIRELMGRGVEELSELIALQLDDQSLGEILETNKRILQLDFSRLQRRLLKRCDRTLRCLYETMWNTVYDSQVEALVSCLDDKFTGGAIPIPWIRSFLQ